jgi:hypothetical protein
VESDKDNLIIASKKKGIILYSKWNNDFIKILWKFFIDFIWDDLSGIWPILMPIL